MDNSRRDFVAAGGLLAALIAAGSKAADLVPASAPAWNQAAFEAKTVADALRALGIAVARDSGDLELTAPEIAEDGAVVPVIAKCRAAGTREIHILVDKNPFSLAASFFFPDGTDAFVSTRIKMAETSNVLALAVTSGQAYLARKQIKVTIGGCGG
jgi:sulfur-oxidizing protein SoxY